MVEREEREIILTKEGLLKLETELETLKSTRREEVAERIKQAIAFGDISENSEYEDAKNEQAFIEGRILTLVASVESKLKDGKISDESPVGKAIMSKTVGTKVEVVAPVGKIKYKILK